MSGRTQGCWEGSSFGIFDDTPVIVYAETAVEGITIDKPALVSKAVQAFERLRSEALPRGASRDLIGELQNNDGPHDQRPLAHLQLQRGQRRRVVQVAATSSAGRVLVPR